MVDIQIVGKSPVDDYIYYNYNDLTITSNSITSKTNTDNLKYLTLPFPDSNNVFYKDLVYNASNVYIYGVLHNNIMGVTKDDAINSRMKDTNIVGELVIEHRPSTNGNKIYFCFFLKNPDQSSANSSPTSIDNMLTVSTSTATSTVTITNDITNVVSASDTAGAVVYTSNMNNQPTIVVVFITPIVLSQRLDSALYNTTTKLFNISPDLNSDYDVIATNHIQNNNFPTVENDIYIECTPTGESNETIQTYNVPINSGMMLEKSTSDFLQTAMHFFMFFILLSFLYIAVPVFYKNVVVNKIIQLTEPYLFKQNAGDDRPSPNSKLLRVNSADMIMSIFCLVIIISLVGYGANLKSKDDPNSKMVYIGAILFSITWFLSSLIIYNSKDDNDFMSRNNASIFTQLMPTREEKEQQYNKMYPFMIDDLILFVGVTLNFFVAEDPKLGRGFSSRRIVWLIGFLLMFNVIMYALKYTNNLDMSPVFFNTTMSFMQLYIIPIFFYLMIYIGGDVVNGIRKTMPNDGAAGGQLPVKMN